MILAGNCPHKPPLLQGYIRSVSINLDGVDAALSQASCVQKWTVVTQLHALAREVVSLEQLHPVVLSMLRRIKTHPPAESRQQCSPSPHCRGLWPSPLWDCIHVQTLTYRNIKVKCAGQYVQPTVYIWRFSSAQLKSCMLRICTQSAIKQLKHSDCD